MKRYFSVMALLILVGALLACGGGGGGNHGAANSPSSASSSSASSVSISSVAASSSSVSAALSSSASSTSTVSVSSSASSSSALSSAAVSSSSSRVSSSSASSSVASSSSSKASSAASSSSSSLVLGANDVLCSGALQTCVDQVAAKGAGTVYLQSKTYLLTDSVTLKSDVNIIGVGSSSLITWDDSVKNTVNKPLLYGQSSGVQYVNYENFRLLCSLNLAADDLRESHMGMYMNGSGAPGSTDAYSNGHIYLKNIEVSHCSHGIHLKGLDYLTTIDLNLHDNSLYASSLFHNIYLKRAEHIKMIQTSLSSGGFYNSATGHGMRLSQLNNVYFDTLHVYNNGDHGMHMDEVSDLRSYNELIENSCQYEFSGTCYPQRCYGTCSAINMDAAKEVVSTARFSR